MPRNFGRFTTSIWLDEDFTGLDPGQQAAYFMLSLQGEVTAAGTLPLTYRRWSKNARGWTPSGLELEVKALEAAGHVLVDEDTEELLIRTFIKWDGGYGNSKRLPVIVDAGRGIRSPHLRRAVARELIKLGLPDAAADIAPDALSPHPSDTASDEHSDTASDSQSASDRNGVKLGDQIPQSPIPSEATPTPQSPLKNDCSAEPSESTDENFDAFWDAYPKHAAKIAARRRWDTLMKRGVDPREIIAGAVAYAREVRALKTERQFIKQPDGWLNAGRWEDERIETRPTTAATPFWEN